MDSAKNMWIIRLPIIAMYDVTFSTPPIIASIIPPEPMGQASRLKIE